MPTFADTLLQQDIKKIREKGENVKKKTAFCYLLLEDNSQ